MYLFERQEDKDRSHNHLFISQYPPMARAKAMSQQLKTGLLEWQNTITWAITTPPSTYISWKKSQKLEPGIESRHSNVIHGVLTTKPKACTLHIF